ncbi:hypothetical protein [Streptomyces europaeiscabiei]|uniref:hypothetical protein n=1 Tax=Streptomyces europaeiscabiei TaxID=146819 RepID=UPI002E143B81
MRSEELAGLRPRDVDLDNLVIRVRIAEPERTNGKRAPGETKTDAGVRAMVLPAFLHKEVRQHLAWFAEKETWSACSRWEKSGSVTGRRVPCSGSTTRATPVAWSQASTCTVRPIVVSVPVKIASQPVPLK